MKAENMTYGMVTGLGPLMVLGFQCLIRRNCKISLANLEIRHRVVVFLGHICSVYFITAQGYCFIWNWLPYGRMIKHTHLVCTQ